MPDEVPATHAALGAACVVFDGAGRVLLVHHTYGRRNWELPGGGSEPGEAPDETATRELLEETGYVSDDWSCIGQVIPNPAIQNNTCYIFLAAGSRKEKDPSFDTTEYIVTFKAPVEDIPKLVLEKRITHSLVVSAFYWYCLRTGR